MTAWFSGCLVRPIETADGILTWDRIAPQVRAKSAFWAPTGLITLENTHNMHGGTVYPLDVIRDICDRAHGLGINVHMDGARVFNAAAALGISVSEIAASVDTLMFCLTKGLAAPVGSMLVGPADLIERGRLYRKRLGGGMRQAGVLAAAGLIALKEMPQRLAKDHENARVIADRLRDVPGIHVTPVATNIVVIDLKGPTAEFIARVRDRGVLISTAGGTRVRALTHLDVSRAECELAASAIAAAVPAPDS